MKPHFEPANRISSERRSALLIFIEGRSNRN